jgi:hypothetical protein
MFIFDDDLYQDMYIMIGLVYNDYSNSLYKHFFHYLDRFYSVSKHLSAKPEYYSFLASQVDLEKRSCTRTKVFKAKLTMILTKSTRQTRTHRRNKDKYEHQIICMSVL